MRVAKPPHDLGGRLTEQPHGHWGWFGHPKILFNYLLFIIIIIIIIVIMAIEWFGYPF
jgi:hypothetical protein